jgi:hypothetical protein
MNQLTQTINTADVTSDAGGIAVRSYGINEYTRRFLNGDDLGSSKKGRPTKPYAQVLWYYSAIKFLAEQIGGLPLVLSRPGNDEPVTSGKAFTFWENIDVSTLIEETVGWKSLTGESHWVIDGNIRAVQGIRNVIGRPVLKALSDTNKTELLAWEWRHGKIKEHLSLDEIVSNIAWNPYVPFRGLSSAEAGAVTLGSDYAASLHNESLLLNGGMPAGTLQTDDDMQPDEMDDVLDRWNSRHGGSGGSGKVGILNNGLSWQSTAQTLNEMQYEALKKMNREEIIGGLFHIQPILLGVQDKSSYAFFDAAMEHFWTQTAPPLVGDVNDMLQVITDGVQAGLVAKLDIKSASIFAKLFAETIDQAKTLSEIGFNRNNINQVLRLGMDEDEGGEETWVSNNQVPQTFILEGKVPAVTTPPEPKGVEPSEEKALSDEATDEGLRRDIWFAWIRSYRSLQNSYQQRLRKYFAAWEKAMLGRLSQAVKGVKIEDPPEVMRVDFALLLGSIATQNEILRGITAPHYDKTTQLGLVQGVTEMDAALDVLPATDGTINAFKQSQVIKIVEVNQTVRKKVQDSIRAAMKESAAANETTQELTTRIRSALKASMKQSRSRALTIARTETGKAISTGRHRGAMLAGAESHGWISSKINVRDTHVTADSRYASKGQYIDINQRFEVGSALLRYPLDPNGPPGEVINCRCLELHSIDKAGTAMPLIEILERGFVTAEDMDRGLYNETS